MLVVSGLVARYTARVSFMNRAKEMAEQAASQAQQAAGIASHSATDPATQEKLGPAGAGGVGAARRGVSTVVERIDPGVLADLIVKSTALQEMTNASLREKNSPYRIAEIEITASIPPGVTFSISRMDDGDDHRRGRVVRGSRRRAARPRRGGHLARRHEPDQEIAEVRKALANEVPRGPQPAPEQRLDLLDRARGALTGRSFRDLDPARRERSRG